MSATTLEDLRQAWPGRITLRADEVALVLRGKNTRKVVERIRNNMKAGAYGEGARKVDGVWQLPLTDLANVIDPPPAPIVVAVEPTSPKKASRRRSKIGPSLTFVRQSLFWASVMKAMGLAEAEAMAKEALDVVENLHQELREEKAKRERGEIRKALGLKEAKKRPHFKPGGL